MPTTTPAHTQFSRWTFQPNRLERPHSAIAWSSSSRVVVESGRSRSDSRKQARLAWADPSVNTPRRGCGARRRPVVAGPVAASNRLRPCIGHSTQTRTGTTRLMPPGRPAIVALPVPVDGVLHLDSPEPAGPVPGSNILPPRVADLCQPLRQFQRVMALTLVQQSFRQSAVTRPVVRRSFTTRLHCSSARRKSPISSNSTARLCLVKYPCNPWTTLLK